VTPAYAHGTCNEVVWRMSVFVLVSMSIGGGGDSSEDVHQYLEAAAMEICADRP